MTEPSRAERAVVESLRVILARTEVGGELWAADYDTDDGKRLLSALEFFLPAVLREAHPFWKGESLDAFHTVTRRKVDERSAELFGLAQLISDQRWTPFELELRLSASDVEVESLRCRIGSLGDGKGGLDRRFTWRERDKAVRSLLADRATIPWVFGVTQGSRS